MNKTAPVHPRPASLFDAVNAEALERFLDTREIGSGPLVDFEHLAGGTQNILVRFRRGEQVFVLRRPPLHPRPGNNETMMREAHVLAALAGTAVPHPRLITACDDESLIGAAFYLMAPVDGFNAVNGMPHLHAGRAELRNAMGLALVDGASTLAAIDHVAVGLEDFGQSDGFLERQVPRWLAQLEGYGAQAGWPGASAIPGVERVAEWLERWRPRSFRPGIMHGDYHLGNVMYRPDGPEIAAIVDWELATIGDPLLDLGWLLATWPDEDGSNAVVGTAPWQGFPSRQNLIARYADRSDRDLGAVTWYMALACFKLGIILEGTHARACAGKADQASGDRLHALCISLFNRALGLLD